MNYINCIYVRPGVVALDKGPIYGLNRTKPWFEFTVFCI